MKVISIVKLVNIVKLIDLSHSIEHDMPVYPGDSEVKLSQEAFLDRDHYNNFRLETGMHSGTHIDSPMHLTASERFISQVPLDVFIGQGCIINAEGKHAVELEPEHEAIIKQHGIVLIYTGWDKLFGTDGYFRNYPFISLELCCFFVEKQIRLLGIDGPSPDNPPFPVHKTLFKNNIYLLENLTNLDKLLEVKHFEVMAFPLRIEADSSPVRAVARVLEE